MRIAAKNQDGATQQHSPVEVTCQTGIPENHPAHTGRDREKDCCWSEDIKEVLICQTRECFCVCMCLCEKTVCY